MTLCATLPLLLLHALIASGVHISIVPDRNAFVLFTPHQGTNQSKSLIYLQNGCPSSNEQSVVSCESGRRHFLPLSSIRNLECAITIKIASTVIPLERPYVDVIAVADVSELSYIRQALCVSTQLNFASSFAAPTSCTISPFDSPRHSCIIRTIVPFSWFPPQEGDQKQPIVLSHSVGSDCSSPRMAARRTKLYLSPPAGNYQSTELDKQANLQLSIRTRSNVSFSVDSMTTVLAHLKFSESAMHLTAIQLRIWLDTRLEIISAASADPTMWSVRVESTDLPESHTTFTCHFTADEYLQTIWLDTRLEIISAASADPTMWSVRVESTDLPESHTTFTCHFTADEYLQTWDGYILMILMKMRTERSARSTFVEQDDTAEATVHWALQYILDQNSTHTEKTVTKRVTTRFKISADTPYVLVPLMKDSNLINTAILSGHQTSMPMRVLTVSEGGLLTDVTANSHCISAESRVLKTSPTCSSVYVDGSELRGMAKIKVHVHYEAWTTSVELTVWYPKLPITVWISDPVLNAVRDWQIAVWKWLPQGRRKKEARQFGCTHKFQQAEVRILAAFQVGDERTGERIYLSGQRDTLFDVTAISADHVHSSNLGVVTIHRHEGRIFLNALRPGSARITVRSHTPNIDYGSAPVVVTEDMVSVHKITAEVVVDIDVGIMHAVEKPHEFLISSRIQNVLTHRYQHALLAYRVHYSDEQSIELSDVAMEEYMLNVWSGDERSLAVIQRSNHALVELIALDDAHDAVINAQLRSPPHCVDPDSAPIASQETLVRIRFDDTTRTSRNTFILREANTTITTDLKSRSWRLEALLAALIFVIVVIGVLHLLGYRGRRPLSEGYEKLVLPIITRLSSSGSCGKDENSHEWVWLSKAQIDSGSINSRYSQKSTVGMAENSMSSVDTNRSVSYRGSEISVFISPQPVVSVNNDTLGRHTTSWRDKPKVRMARNAMLDSSSEHNLSRYTNGSVMLARSEGEMRESWREMDARYPCRREESWRNTARSSRWSGSGPMPEYLSGLRESVA
ncbi:Transmembrane protein [Toxocara canis]|uniref:Transmembrane protein n=1 Tax=Toxocara canis TaxID=6265 RepID=A0A0B2UTJ3_TOXCA|nr:Transmembrane protein [Toxocara canis]